jgi:hypothetical protein
MAASFNHLLEWYVLYGHDASRCGVVAAAKDADSAHDYRLRREDVLEAVERFRKAFG